ncbi:hypothetical protein AWC38_SpisGene1313 [Stylophora pistillata]|uniref:Uncharacterized protein n=1 Tax=Stylophora pistillata TaxID=50429 RepID=A0A2B4SXN5_STYPI|nr:hypothetical protein AWC38_SpisGene1313 [Stylophora pistillata]
MKTENSADLLRTQGALNAAWVKLTDAEHQLETNLNTMMKELVRTLEQTKEELARERSYVAQAFDNDEELIRIKDTMKYMNAIYCEDRASYVRIKDELQKAEQRCKELEKEISSLNQVIEDSQAKKNALAKETDNVISEKATEMAALTKKLEAATQEVRDAKAEVEAIKGEYKEKESRLELMKKEFGEKVTELDNTKKDICDKMAALNDLRKQVTEKETELKNIKEENLKTTAELKKALEEEIAVLSKKECELFQANRSVDLNKESAQDKLGIETSVRKMQNWRVSREELFLLLTVSRLCRSTGTLQVQGPDTKAMKAKLKKLLQIPADDDSVILVNEEASTPAFNKNAKSVQEELDCLKSEVLNLWAHIKEKPNEEDLRSENSRLREIILSLKEENKKLVQERDSLSFALQIVSREAATQCRSMSNTSNEHTIVQNMDESTPCANKEQGFIVK